MYLNVHVKGNKFSLQFSWTREKISFIVVLIVTGPQSQLPDSPKLHISIGGCVIKLRFIMWLFHYESNLARFWNSSIVIHHQVGMKARI